MVYSNPWLWLTVLGTPELWLGVAGVLVVFYLVFRKRPGFKKSRKQVKSFLWVFVVSMLLVFGTVLLVKNTAQIPRPCGPESLQCPADFSFPSGHSAAIFVFFASLLVFLKKKWLPLAIVPVLVAYSRIALGVHTLADVLAGALLGLVVPVLIWVFLGKKKI